MNRGIFIGRFQPFHLGHLNDVKEALHFVDELLIGVGCSEESGTKKNPFSSKEREDMISLALKDENIFNYRIFPIPDFNDDEKWLNYIEDNLPKFDTVFISDKETYSEEWVERCFKGKYEIKKIKAVPNVAATLIRGMLTNGDDWKKFVTKSVASYINSIDGVKRIKKINKD